MEPQISQITPIKSLYKLLIYNRLEKVFRENVHKKQGVFSIEYGDREGKPF